MVTGIAAMATAAQQQHNQQAVAVQTVNQAADAEKEQELTVEKKVTTATPALCSQQPNLGANIDLHA